VQRRFHRAEKSRHTPGNGLGLSLVAAVARLHGMELSIEDVAPGARIALVRSDAALSVEPRVVSQVIGGF
jgi:signal transduction histidine kinase